MKKTILKYCNNCKEDSIKTKYYVKDNQRCIVCYCINKGCGYSIGYRLSNIDDVMVG